DKSTTPENRLGVIKDMELVFAREGLDEDFLVLGGDNFFSDPLSGFMDFAKLKNPQATIGVYDVHSKKEASNYGVLSINKAGRLVKFEEKPKAPQSTLVGMCLYYFPAKKLKLIKKYLKDGKHSQDAAGNYIKWLISEDKVYGFIFKNLWCDIGRIQTYKKLNEILSKGKVGRA
ncbi:nucleotidyltransferase family protein, partial [bacterium]